jgi:lysozyme
MIRAINNAGLALIKSFEKCSLNIYLDEGGAPTIGWGHLILPGEDFSAGITQDQADTLLLSDLYDAQKDVCNIITTTLNGNQYGACVSFRFNAGVKPLVEHFGMYLNAGNFIMAASQFDKWIFVKGKISNGLQRRRAAEKALFLMPINSD